MNNNIISLMTFSTASVQKIFKIFRS